MGMALAMASVASQTITISSYMCSSRTTSDSPHRYSTKAFVGLRSEPTGLCINESSDLTIAFHERVQQNIKSRFGQKGTSRACITMMPIGTPKVPYRTPGEGSWQWIDIWNALYRERIIFIGQHIDEEFSNQILATMLYLDSIDSSKNLYLYINGPGGDITPCMAIYDTMESLKSPIGTLCLGYAYNLAGFLLAAGAKGRRVAMPLSRVALQSPAGAARGQADDIQNEAKELLRIRDYMFDQLAIKTGQPVEKIAKDLSRIKRFSAQEALDYGLIDRIVRPRRVKPDASSKKEAGAGYFHFSSCTLDSTPFGTPLIHVSSFFFKGSSSILHQSILQRPH